VNNHMVWAVLTTLFCCLPFGIVAIVKASQVSSKLAMGDYAGAVAASNQAKTWSIVSMVIGLVVGVIYLFVIVGIGAAANSGY